MEQAEQKLLKARQMLTMVKLNPARQERMRENVARMESKLEQQRDALRLLGAREEDLTPASSEAPSPPENATASALSTRIALLKEKIALTQPVAAAEALEPEEEPILTTPAPSAFVSFESWQATRRQQLTQDLARVVEILDHQAARDEASSSLVQPKEASEPPFVPAPSPGLTKLASAGIPVKRGARRKLKSARLSVAPSENLDQGRELRRLAMELQSLDKHRERERVRLEALLDQLVDLRRQLDAQAQQSYELGRAQIEPRQEQEATVDLKRQRSELQLQIHRLEQAHRATQARLQAETQRRSFLPRENTEDGTSETRIVELNARLLQENKQLQEERDALHTSLDELTALHGRIFRDFDSLTRERDRLRESLDSQSESIRRLEAHDRERIELEQRMAELTRLRHREVQAQVELQAALYEARQNESQLDTFESENEQLKLQLEASQAEALELQERVRALDELLSHETELRRFLLNQSQLLEQQLSAVQLELEQSRHREESLQLKVQHLQHGQESRAPVSYGEASGLQQQLHGLEVRLVEEQCLREQLEVEREELVEQLKALEKPVETDPQVTPDERVRQLEEQLLLTEKELYHRQRQYVEESLKLDRMTDDFHRASVARKELEERLAEMLREQESLFDASLFETSEDYKPVALPASWSEEINLPELQSPAPLPPAELDGRSKEVGGLPQSNRASA